MARNAWKFLLGSLTVYLVVAICNGNRIVDAGADDGGMDAHQGDESGSRLKLRYYAGDDGSKLAAGMWDTMLQTPCRFLKTMDGSLRCLPTPDGYATTAESTTTIMANGSSLAAFFSDPECRVPMVLFYPQTCSPPPKYLLVGDVYGNAELPCRTDQSFEGAVPLAVKYYRIFSARKLQLQETVYQGRPGACTGMAFTGSNDPRIEIYAGTDEHRPAEFVAAALKLD